MKRNILYILCGIFLLIGRQQKILCKWEMREVIGNICKTFPYIFIVYYFFLLPLVKS